MSRESAAVLVVATAAGQAAEGRDAGLLDVSREGWQGVGRGRPAGREIVPRWEIVLTSVLVQLSAPRYSSKQRVVVCPAAWQARKPDGLDVLRRPI